MTVESFKQFMSGIIDYAGLYPPASLSLEEAFQNFIRYQDDPESWMLARFVIPAKRLADLTGLMEHSAALEKTLSFTALGRSGEGVGELIHGIEFDIADIRSFRALHEPRIIVDMFETALPVSELADPARCEALIRRAVDLLSLEGLTVYLEAPFGDGWQERAGNLIHSLQKTDGKACFKLRTGGVTADAFPSPEHIAWAIAEARDAGVPMKCTAGLHHPIRHFNESVQTKMHGFLNVFGAGIIASAKNLTQAEIQPILEDENGENFLFDENGFTWRDLRVVNLEIQQARRLLTSFGSCSFDEPREDLDVLFRGRDVFSWQNYSP